MGGLTSFGERLRLHKGLLVGERDVVTREKKKALDKNERCHLCWFFGERQCVTKEVQGKFQLVIVAFWKNEHVFTDAYPILMSTERDAMEKVRPGEACLAGLKTWQEAVQLVPLDNPRKSRCFQQRTCEPN